MNYDTVIVELLSRVQALEEQMAMLRNETIKISTDDIFKYICQLKESAKLVGEKTIILRSGNIHKDLKLKSAMPQVCNAMRQAMNKGDIVLHTTPSGNSSTIEIQYYV